MNYSKLFVLFNLFIVLTIIRSEISGLTSQQEVHDNVVVIDQDGNDIRALTYSSLPGTFFVSGVTANVQGNSASVTTSSFYFSSGSSSFLSLPLSYFYSYTNGSVTPGSVKAQGSVAAFAPSLIVEYEEANGQDGFQLDGDTVLGWIRLDQYKNFDIQDSSSVIEADGVSTKVYIIDATSPNGVFSLRFVVPGASIAMGDVQLSAEQSKADIVIESYYDNLKNQQSMGCTTSSAKFSCESTGPSNNQNSRLALASFFLSAGYSVNVNSDTLSVAADGVEIGLNWVSNVIVNSDSDSKTVKVFASTYASSQGETFMNAKFSGQYSGQLLIHSFDSVRPTSVAWDPTLGAGVSTSSSSKLSISLYLIVSFLFAYLLF